MIMILALLLMVVAFFVALLPLLQPAAGRIGRHGDVPDDSAAGDRDAAYVAIKDLEFEHELGNLSEEDYRELRAEYVERAARALQALDGEREGRTSW